MISVDVVCWMLLKVAIHRINSMTIKSWTIRIPILSLHDVDSISSLSHKSFKTTIVLLKENPMAKNVEVIGSNHSTVAMKYPNIPVIPTWKIHAMSDVFPRSLMMVGLSSIPTMKSNNAIPKFPNDWKAVFAWSSDGINILIAVPAIIYQIIIGCLSIFIKPMPKSTIQMTILSEVNTCSAIRRNTYINTLIISEIAIFVKSSIISIICWLIH